MQQLGKEPRAFTTSYNGRSNVLASKVGIIEALDPTRPPANAPKEFLAVWDTGATNSVITENVIIQCQLKPTGITVVDTAQGSHRTETYLVGIVLPNLVGFPSVRVSKGTLTSAYDVLIGMDIIGSGDFAVTNKDGKTVFSFRLPSTELIDFVKHPQYRTPASSVKVGRNARCSCGSGKKYKNCHGGKV
jgi:hypothetical protein